MIADKYRFRTDSILHYISENPDGDQIPIELIDQYRGEKNLQIQTPLMRAVMANNVNYVKQLLIYDVGNIDENDKTALDYAIEYKNKNKSIIYMLNEYEKTPSMIISREDKVQSDS